MNRNEIQLLILKVLQGTHENYPLATYVIKNKVNNLLYTEKSEYMVSTNTIRLNLRHLEKFEKVKIIPTSYKIQLSWCIVN